MPYLGLVFELDHLTMQGVRDTMVSFVTGASTTHPPASIQSSLLKQCRTYCEACFPEDPLQAIFCRLAHLRLAVEGLLQTEKPFNTRRVGSHRTAACTHFCVCQIGECSWVTWLSKVVFSGGRESKANIIALTRSVTMNYT
jgi:hypothetical protein